MCNAVSSDGKIIGGRGNSLYAVEGAWLWSEEKGLQLLNPEEGADDMVYDMTTTDLSWLVSLEPVIVHGFGAKRQEWLR